MISKDTATDMALLFRDIESSERLLKEIEEAVRRYSVVDIRDAFGRRADGLQLGVPSGDSSHRIFNVPWSLAKPVIEATIASKRAELAALNEKARFELLGSKLNGQIEEPRSGDTDGAEQRTPA